MTNKLAPSYCIKHRRDNRYGGHSDTLKGAQRLLVHQWRDNDGSIPWDIVEVTAGIETPVHACRSCMDINRRILMKPHERLRRWWWSGARSKFMPFIDGGRMILRILLGSASVVFLVALGVILANSIGAT